jgi:HK97 family phage prohead protease
MSLTIPQQIIRKVVSATATKGTTPGTNVFTLSTKEVDRDGDTIDPAGWNLSEYQENPTVLWGHDSKSLPIGRCPEIRAVGGKLKATIEWPPRSLYPFADQLHDLVNAGFVRSASVGFRPDASSPNAFGGRDIHEATLLEWSVVNIPSNPSATLERGVDMMRLKSWLGQSGKQQSKEDDMYLELVDDEPFFELLDSKDMSAFDHMCAQMLAAYSEMDSEKFRELMARQLALLGPAASIVDLVHALAQQGVAAPRSAPGFRHMTQGELMNYKNACDARAGYYPY